MKNRTILGIERVDEFNNVFRNKRIGLITNLTGIDGNFKSSIDILREKTNLVGLFSPEHGVRASIQAGEHLDILMKKQALLYIAYMDRLENLQKKSWIKLILCLSISKIVVPDIIHSYIQWHTVCKLVQNMIKNL